MGALFKPADGEGGVEGDKLKFAPPGTVEGGVAVGEGSAAAGEGVCIFAIAAG